MNAFARVRRYVDVVGASLCPPGEAPPDPALVTALVVETGLSPANVAYALRHHVEARASDAEIARMIHRAPAAPAHLVVLPANVFVAPFRSIACALASAPRVLVKASRRASVVPHRIVAAARAAGLAIERVESLDDAWSQLPTGSHVSIEGSDEAIASVRAQATERHADLHVRGHGPGIGLVIGHAHELAREASAIANDVAVFDQRGCLSPRIVAVIGGEPAEVVDALAAALESLERQRPRGALTVAEASAVRRALDAACFLGAARENAASAVAWTGAIPTLLPAARVLDVFAASDVAAAAQAIEAAGLLTRVTTVGASPSIEAEVVASFPRSRVSPLGAMQRPPFDGPVDLRD